MLDFIIGAAFVLIVFGPAVLGSLQVLRPGGTDSDS